MALTVDKGDSVLFVSKNPDTINTFEIDWSNVLDTGEAITGESHTAPAGITVVDSGTTGTISYYNISGGDPGTEYDLTVSITTSATPQRTLSRTLRLFIKGTSLTLDATVGGTTSNAYLTIAEANAYLINRPVANDWFTASVSARTNAIVAATELLDRYVLWNGEKANDDQALEWPRNNVKDRYGRDVDNATIPQNVKNATALLAEVLLTEDVQRERDDTGLASMAVPGVVSLVFDKKDKRKIIPEIVRAQLTGLGRVHGYQTVVDVVRA